MSEKFLNSDRISELWSKTKEYVDNAVSGSDDTAVLVKSPVGTIVIWSGTADNIPTGWQLCDGANGTPDLRDKFVLGAGTKHGVGSTGGSEEVTLMVEQMPEHTHTEQAYVPSNNSIKYAVRDSGSQGKISGVIFQTTLTEKGYEYVRTFKSGSSQPHPNMPPYYALCYIMKLVADPTDGVTQEELNTALADKQDTLVNGTGTTVLNNSVNINTPVQGVYTQAEFDALPDAQKSKGLYVIPGESGGPGGVGTGVPSGFIGMWHGTVDAVPDGWALCDGTNGTPDLRDKFVLGAGTKHAVGSSGGEETHKLTISEMPSHYHDITVWSDSPDAGSASGRYPAQANYQYKTRSTSTTASRGGDSTHNNMPPYYTLAYIMKL